MAAPTKPFEPPQTGGVRRERGEEAEAFEPSPRWEMVRQRSEPPPEEDSGPQAIA